MKTYDESMLRTIRIQMDLFQGSRFYFEEDYRDLDQIILFTYGWVKMHHKSKGDNYDPVAAEMKGYIGLVCEIYEEGICYGNITWNEDQEKAMKEVLEFAWYGIQEYLY